MKINNLTPGALFDPRSIYTSSPTPSWWNGRTFRHTLNTSRNFPRSSPHANNKSRSKQRWSSENLSARCSGAFSGDGTFFVDCEKLGDAAISVTVPVYLSLPCKHNKSENRFCTELFMRSGGPDGRKYQKWMLLKTVSYDVFALKSRTS